MGKEKTLSCSNICSHFSVFFLVLVNALLGTIGVIIVGFSAYGFANFAEFEDLISQQAIIYSMCVGLILFLLSLIAIFGALNKMKKLLSVYVVLILILTVSEVIIVILGLEYLGVISGVTDAEVEGSESLNSREAIVNDFLLRSYQSCCVLEPEFCDALIIEINFCEPVQVCSNEAVSADSVCIVNSDSVEPVDISVCTAIDNINSGLIAPASEGGCGNGTAAGYLEDIADTIEDEFTAIGSGFAVIIFIEFLLILFTMFIILGKKVDYNKAMPWDDDTEEEIALAEPVGRAELLRLSVMNSQPIATPDAAVRSQQQERRLSTEQPQRAAAPTPAAVETEPTEEAEEESAPVTQASPKNKKKRPKEIRMSIGRETIKNNPNAINEII